MKRLYKVMTGCVTVCALVLLYLPHRAQATTVCLEKPIITSVAATSKGTVELGWDEVDGAQRYEIYRKSEKQDEYKKIAQVKKEKYVDKTGKANITYSYQVKAVSLDPDKNVIQSSACSKRQKCKVRKKDPKVAYVGDSIMTGFTCYGTLKGRKKCKVFAEIGMNTGRFYGSSKMQELLRYNPDRMYIMMGVNGMGSSNTAHLEAILNSYEKILDACRKKNPDMEIIVMSVAPVRPGATVSSDAIRKFNTMLKKMASEKNGVYYYHMASILADSQGYLISKYSGGDGVHWSVGTYRYVLENLDEYVKKL